VGGTCRRRGAAIATLIVRVLAGNVNVCLGGLQARASTRGAGAKKPGIMDLEPEAEIAAGAAAAEGGGCDGGGGAVATGAAASSVVLVREYGVVLLRGALSEQEQRDLLSNNVKARCVAGKDFHVSSGVAGSAHHSGPLHALGEELFRRVGRVVCGQLTAAQIQSEPSFCRISQAYTGEKPATVSSVTGVVYGCRKLDLHNHTDLDRPLYTMSVALGDSCDFTVGRKTARPHKRERSGKPVTLRMKSGDAMFFDGGSIPHAVGPLHAGSGPGFWQQSKPAGATRIALLFREPS
jgi:hypothetical protein